MSQNSVEVNVEQTNEAAKGFEPTTDEMQSSIHELTYIRDSQSERKWSDREVPLEFAGRYRECMDKGVTELERLQGDLNEFIALVRHALNSSAAVESDQEMAAKLSTERLEELASKSPDDDQVHSGYKAGRSHDDARAARIIRGAARPV